MAFESYGNALSYSSVVRQLEVYLLKVVRARVTLASMPLAIVDPDIQTIN